MDKTMIYATDMMPPNNLGCILLNLVATQQGIKIAQGYANVKEYEGVKYRLMTRHPKFFMKTIGYPRFAYMAFKNTSNAHIAA